MTWRDVCADLYLGGACGIVSALISAAYGAVVDLRRARRERRVEIVRRRLLGLKAS